jgi:hypothetical protein
MTNIINILNSVLGNSKFLDLFKGKETKKNEFLMELSKQLHEANYRQTEINKIEAKSNFWYVASWRPTIGYICALGLFYSFFLRHIFNYIILIFDNDFPIPPEIDISQLISILVAMLGMAGYRTFEKFKKVN